MNDDTDEPRTAHLLTALGARADEVPYSLDGHTVTAPLAPLALMRLIGADARPGQVTALATGIAERETLPRLRGDLAAQWGLEPGLVRIPDGRDGQEVRVIVERITEAVPEGARLVLDVTHGFRHFPFVAYAAALYLRSMKRVELRAAYYGMLEGRGDGAAPLIDLQPLLELPDWFHAVQVFTETGRPGVIAERIRRWVAELRARARAAGNDKALHQQASGVAKLADRLADASFTHECGLPIEHGRSLRDVREQLAEGPDAVVAERLPLAGRLYAALDEAAAPTSLGWDLPGKGQWKASVSLDDAELQRQADLIDGYLARGQLPLAFGLMREWTVSWAILHHGDPRRWLERDHRHRHEQLLGALAAYQEKAGSEAALDEDQAMLARFWMRLSHQIRNVLHHHGMRPDAFHAGIDAIEKVREDWRRLRTGNRIALGFGGVDGRLLVAAQGRKAGVLYSAIAAAKPDACLVLCSSETAASVEPATREAGFRGGVSVLEIGDVHQGFDELKRLREEASRDLLGASTVVASLTGGTTMMGIAVQELVRDAQRLGREAARFALIDRRGPDEQERRPYVAAEAHWLDPIPGAAGS